MKKRFLTILSCTLFGCASNSGILSIGNGNYVVSKQVGTFFTGLANVKSEIILEGNMYCKNMNKEFSLISYIENQGPYIFGHYPRAEIEFTCK